MNAIRIKGNPARGLTAATIGFFFGAAAISLFGPSVIRLSEIMVMSPFKMGLLVAIPTLSGSLLRIPFGASVDVHGGRKSFLLLMSLSIVGLLGLSYLFTARFPGNMDGTYWLILLFGCLSGCGIATFSVGAGQSSYWYPKRKQGLALGIFGGLGTLGAGVFAIVLPLLLKKVGFVSAYHIWTLCMIFGLVVYAVLSCNAYYFQYRKKGFDEEQSKKMATEDGQELFPTGNLKKSLLISAKIPETWILVIDYFVTFGGFMALTAWLPTYWHNTHGLTATEAGLFTAVYACLAAVLRIPAGKLSDKMGGLKVSLIALVILGIISAIMAFSNNLALSAFCTVVIAIAFGMNNAAVMKLVPVYVSKSVGGASGWVGGLGAFGGFVLPPVLGKVVDISGFMGYYHGFLVFTALSIIVIIILYFGLIVRHKKNNTPL